MVKQYDKLLVPYDGSSFSKKAISEAAMISKTFGSQIMILNVVNESSFKEQPSLFSGYIQETKVVKNFTNQALENMENLLQNICFDLEKQGIKATSHVVSGYPKKEILKFAKRQDVDLIVMGSQGLGGMKKLRVLGSASRWITENSDCPVLIVH